MKLLKIFIYDACVCRPSRGGAAEDEMMAKQSTGELRFAYSLLEKLVQYMDRASINMKLLKPSITFSRRSSFKTCTRDIKFFSKVSILNNKALSKLFFKYVPKLLYLQGV